MEITVFSQATAAIPYPVDAQAAAQQAIADYLRLVRKVGETRLAIVGDGDGNVTADTVTRRIYARLGSADGQVIEVKVITPLNPAEGDTILIRRERPFGLEGWILLEWYGAGAVPVIYCDTGFGRLGLLFETYVADVPLQRLFVAKDLIVGGGSINEMTGFQAFIGDEATDRGILGSVSGDEIVNVGNAGTPDFQVVHSEDGWATYSTPYTAPQQFAWPVSVTGVEADWSDLTKVYTAFTKRVETPFVPAESTKSEDSDLYVAISTDSGGTFTEYLITNLTALEPTQVWDSSIHLGVSYTETPHVLTTTPCPLKDGSGVYVCVVLNVPDPEGAFHTYHKVAYLFRVANDGSYVARRQEDGIWFAGFYVKQGAPDVSYHLSGTTLTIYDWGTDTYSQSTLPFSISPLAFTNDQNSQTCFLPDGWFFHLGYSSGWKLWRTLDFVTWEELDVQTQGVDSWTWMVGCAANVLILPQFDGTFYLSTDHGDTWQLTPQLAPDGNADESLGLVWAVGY